MAHHRQQAAALQSLYRGVVSTGWLLVGGLAGLDKVSVLGKSAKSSHAHVPEMGLYLSVPRVFLKGPLPFCMLKNEG